jgi:hypothetical protein
MNSDIADMEKAHIFNVSLTVYSLLKKKASRGVLSRVKTSASTAVKEEKSVKVKELVFSIDNNNYISFLTSLLEKHGQEQYKVSADRCFPFKYLPPGVKV